MFYVLQSKWLKNIYWPIILEYNVHMLTAALIKPTFRFAHVVL